jgi:hypothetical protein
MKKVVDQALVDVATGYKKDAQMGRIDDLMGVFVHHVKSVAPWWSRMRDSQLRSAWKDGENASIVMGKAQNKLAAIPIKIIPNDLSIVAHVRQANDFSERLMNNSELGLGLHQTMLKFAEDYLGQDNGAFLEILGEGDPAGPIVGPVLGIRHLDASYCTRTSDPVYPVIYTGEDGKQYKFHNARVIFISQMPSAKREMHNVGFCSMSRSLRIVQNMHNVLNYQDEKMGARAASQILIGSGITGKEIIKTIAASSHMMDNLGLENMARTVALGSATGDIDLKRIELNNFDPFDEETTKTFAAYALASAWGLEFQELIPVSGTKNSEIVSLQRARVGLPQAFIKSFTQQANMKLVPPYLQIQMDFVDDQADQQHAIIEDITSRSFERQMAAGVTTPEVVQQILFERGYINRSQLRSMQLSRGKLENGTPVQSIFFNKSYKNQILVPESLLLVDENEPEVALAAIAANKVFIYNIVGTTSSGVTHNQAEEVLVALEWLEKEYKSINMKPIDVIVDNEKPVDEDVEDEDSESEDVPHPMDGRLTNQEAGKATDFFLRNNQQFMTNELMKQNKPWKNFKNTLEGLFSQSK